MVLDVWLQINLAARGELVPGRPGRLIGTCCEPAAPITAQLFPAAAAGKPQRADSSAWSGALTN